MANNPDVTLNNPLKKTQNKDDIWAEYDSVSKTNNRWVGRLIKKTMYPVQEIWCIKPIKAKFLNLH